MTNTPPPNDACHYTAVSKVQTQIVFSKDVRVCSEDASYTISYISRYILHLYGMQMQDILYLEIYRLSILYLEIYRLSILYLEIYRLSVRHASSEAS